MPTPIIQKTGSVSGPSGPGEGSNDLVPGEVVSLVNLEPAHAGLPHLWTFDDEPLGVTPVMVDGTTETPSFTVDSDAALAGSYRIKCVVDGLESSIEVFAKPLVTTGGRIVSFKEQLEYDKDGNAKGWWEAETVFKRSVDVLLVEVKASITERQGGISVPSGNSSKVIDLGGVIYPGYILAIAGKLEKAVVSGSVVVNVKINGSTKLTTTLNTINTIFASNVEVPAAPLAVLSGDVVTVEIVGTNYINSTSTPSGLALTAVLSSNLSNAPLTIPDASNSAKGIASLTVAPAVPTQPIAVGDNDGRLPNQNENDALQGTSGVPADGNRFVTNADPRNSDSRTPTAHSHVKADVTDFAHNHVKADVTDFAHTHTESEISDLSHTPDPHNHVVADITDFAHTHTHASTTGQTSDDHHAQVHGLGSADHGTATLTQLNAKVSGATLAALDEIQAFTKQQHPTPLALTDAANIPIVATARNAYTLLATGGVGATREIDNASAVLAAMSWTIAFTNDTGGRDLTFGANYSWGDETPPTFTGQAAGEITLLTFFALSPTKVVVTALTGH